MRKILTVFISFAATLYCEGQNSFSMGANISYGTSAFPMKARLIKNGTSFAAKSGATLSTGIIGRYMISDLIGIESGVSVIHYSFYTADHFRTREIYWKTAADLELINYQLPVLINYKLKLPRKPFNYILVNAGTTIDWLTLSGLTSSVWPRTFRNMASSIKYGREKPNGKFEVGFEVQYSLQEFLLGNKSLGPDATMVMSRLNTVSISLAYFFLNKEQKSQVT